MTARQKKFADNYIQTGIAEQSAVDAGYSVKYARAQGYKLLANVGIKDYIEAQLKAISDAKIADATEVMIYLTDVMRGNIEEAGFDGTPTAPRVADRTKAAELLGKRYAIFTEKLEIDGDARITIVDDIPCE